ncbi:MAG: hypothetical protein BWY83_00465 [bacterium ADurb.Bin478]|nr:MAG: hypothetical protein BWY83_00465 [bacterium ADurb.Bin478]
MEVGELYHRQVKTLRELGAEQGDGLDLVLLWFDDQTVAEQESGGDQEDHRRKHQGFNFSPHVFTSMDQGRE